LSGGLFIVLEGVEGAGKSTQARLLSAWFDQQGIAHTLAREPGGTPVGEAIRRVVLDRGTLTMPAETELFLLLGARAAFVRDVVRPALSDGQVVLADRFDLSTLAYQGYGRGLDLDQVQQANRMATGGLTPDLYLVLDLPVGEGLKRKGRTEAPDRIEREGTSFLTRVRDGYLNLAEKLPEARLVQAQGSPSEIQERLRRVLVEAYPETFPPEQV
jgi:dTMP kinase